MKAKWQLHYQLIHLEKCIVYNNINLIMIKFYNNAVQYKLKNVQQVTSFKS